MKAEIKPKMMKVLTEVKNPWGESTWEWRDIEGHEMTFVTPVTLKNGDTLTIEYVVTDHQE